MGEPVPVHAEGTGDPSTLRWYLGRGLADRPAVRRPLQRLVDSGALTGYDVGPDAVTTRLAPGRTWTQEGSVVRAAVQDSVREHRRHLRDAAPAQRDAVVAEVARDVLDTVVSPVATLHGGVIDIVAVVNGVVSVRTHGACHGCPASTATLGGLLERELRRRLPDVAITVTTSTGV
jgi:Fe-S cluster biogenesis protein NfuA